MFYYNDQTGKGDEIYCRGSGEGGFRDEGIGEREIEEGGCEETIFIVIRETFRFTMPPAITLLR
jgi:hypothetical protein